MVQRTKIRSVIRVISFGLTPLLVPACAVQSERDKTAQQASDVTMLIGAQKLSPPPPAAPGAPPAQKLTTPASYYEPVGPFFFYVETLTANTNPPNKYAFAPTVASILNWRFKP